MPGGKGGAQRINPFDQQTIQDLIIPLGEQIQSLGQINPQIHLALL